MAGAPRGERAYLFLQANMLQGLPPSVGQSQVDAPALHAFGSTDI